MNLNYSPWKIKFSSSSSLVPSPSTSAWACRSCEVAEIEVNPCFCFCCCLLYALAFYIYWCVLPDVLSLLFFHAVSEINDLTWHLPGACRFNGRSCCLEKDGLRFLPITSRVRHIQAEDEVFVYNLQTSGTLRRKLWKFRACSKLTGNRP